MTSTNRMSMNRSSTNRTQMSSSIKSFSGDIHKDPVVKNADMDDEKQANAVDTAKDALLKYSVEKDIAAHIKKEFDRIHNPSWHCIVGKNFGSYVTHETGCFIYFYIDTLAILLFKSG